jgi:hypothetical protein
MTRDEAIEVIARDIIQAQNDPDQVAERWEDHPEIGEHDWSAIVEKVAELTPPVRAGEYDAAYALLSAASKEETE